MGIALRARGLGKSYGRPGAPVQKVLSELSFDIGEGEWVVIMGDSGSGKSTLLNVLAGIDPFDSGELFLDELSWGVQNDETKTLVRRRNMGFVFQNYNLFPFLSAFDNVALPARLNGKNDRESILSLLREVGLEGKAHKFPSELSGGGTATCGDRPGAGAPPPASFGRRAHLSPRPSDGREGARSHEAPS